MGRGRVLSEVRAMRFEEVFGRYRCGRLSCEEAGAGNVGEFVFPVAPAL